MIVTLDYETQAIVNGSPKSPRPVGIAIKKNKQQGKYLAWGHPNENNCDLSEAKATVAEIVLNPTHEIIFHNAKFDLGVMHDHWRLAPKAKVHDTMILAFLVNPHFKSLALKTRAARDLDWPPDEQDLLREWILENVKGATDKNWGAYIGQAPGKLVGKYAIGDVDRTFELFNYYKDQLDG
jgi:DNA polymerase I-like protein with 3'-5' exonuclease and polymerase domains|tara:strand:- start:2692 stop:3234 length:543 start_codon:yes stop_codon:yes gene_type:complete